MASAEIATLALEGVEAGKADLPNEKRREAGGVGLIAALSKRCKVCVNDPAGAAFRRSA